MPLDLLAPSLTLVGLQDEISGFGPMDREIERIGRKNILNLLEFPVQRRTGMTLIMIMMIMLIVLITTLITLIITIATVVKVNTVAHV